MRGKGGHRQRERERGGLCEKEEEDKSRGISGEMSEREENDKRDDEKGRGVKGKDRNK